VNHAIKQGIRVSSGRPCSPELLYFNPIIWQFSS